MEVENYTELVVTLRARTRDLERALAHLRQLTDVAQAHARALEMTQGLAWRCVLHGRRASEPTPASPADPARRE